MESDTNDALATFRQEWTTELNAIVPNSRPSDSLIPRTSDLPTSSSTLLAPRTKTAIDYYAYAVLSEGKFQFNYFYDLDGVLMTKMLTILPKIDEGRMNDALANYKLAFALDSDVDKTFHLASLAKERTSLPASATATITEFRFERTRQVAPDYEKKVAKGKAGAGEEKHHLSTRQYKDALLLSIANTPWVRPAAVIAESEMVEDGNEEGKHQGAILEEAEGDAATKTITPEEAFEQLDFIPADMALPLLLSTLPHEVLILILRSLALSPSHVPSSKSAKAAVVIDPAVPVVPTVIRRGKKPRTLKEEMRFLEIELELEGGDQPWITDVAALERFAASCRMSRILSLESTIWRFVPLLYFRPLIFLRSLKRASFRDVCLRTFVAPHQIRRDESALSLVKQKHGNDWRRFFIEQPRVRLDGCFIAVVTYLRRGESHQAFTTPVHMITFYR
jgi:F-box protein 9